jgi:hypothetical protein
MAHFRFLFALLQAKKPVTDGTFPGFPGEAHKSLFINQ